MCTKLTDNLRNFNNLQIVKQKLITKTPGYYEAAIDSMIKGRTNHGYVIYCSPFAYELLGKPAQRGGFKIKPATGIQYDTLILHKEI